LKIAIVLMANISRPTFFIKKWTKQRTISNYIIIIFDRPIVIFYFGNKCLLRYLRIRTIISTGNIGSQTALKPVFHMEILQYWVSSFADFLAENYISYGLSLLCAVEKARRHYLS